MNVTIFPNEQAFKLQQRDMTLEALRTLILETTAATKEDLPFLKLANFGDKRSLKKCLRNNDNVLSITGIELDYDDLVVPFDEAVSVVKKAKLNALVFTSANYKAAAPKWRILMPTSRTLPWRERVKLVKRANGLFGGIFSGETFTLSQSYFFGSINNNPDHRAEIVEGEFIDLRSDLDAGALGKKKKPKPNGHDTTEAPAALRNAQTSGRGTSTNPHDIEWEGETNETLISNITSGKSYYEELLALSYRWTKDGTPADTLVKILQGLMDASTGPHDDNWHERRNKNIPQMVASAVEKYAPKIDLTASIAAGHGGAAEANVRIKLIPFEEFVLDNSPSYLVQRLLASSALNLVWGPPKCGKTFWVFDVLMHVALGRVYRGRRIQQGTVVYCAFEGTRGLRRRREAWRKKHLEHYGHKVPFYFVTLTIDLIKEHPALIAAIQSQLPSGETPIAVALDTLNRSFVGSESSDEDMSAYVKASDAIREAFDCSAIIVHHCGINETRPRGHTSLTGAVDTQLRVERNDRNDIIVTVEWMKDDEGEGDKIASQLEVIEVGVNTEGVAMTSCVITAIELPKADAPGLTKNEASMIAVLEVAGEAGLTQEEWNERARAEGIGVGRRATLGDLRNALAKKGQVCLRDGRWIIPF